MEGSGGGQYVPGLGTSFLVRQDPSRQGLGGKEAHTVQLVLETGGEKLNLLEYLKTEMLEEKRGEKEGSLASLFDRDISLKIEVLEDGTARAIPDSVCLSTSSKARAALPPVQEEEEVKRRKVEAAAGKLSRPKNYSCEHCDTAFVSTKDLARHSVVHTGEKPYSCPYCDQKFTAPSSRATHIRSIHEKSQEFLCPECDKPFNQKSNMVKHYKTIHLETVVIICQECGRDFNQASALRRHIKIVHKKELTHGCSQCGKRFALAESLKKHMEAIHLKSRAYPCTYCDYAASRADMLKIHIRKIHTKEWSYKCGVCEVKGTPWGCILPKELRRHLQTRHPQEYQEQQEQEEISRVEEEDRMERRADEEKSSRLGKEDVEEGELPPRVETASVEEKAAVLLDQIRQPIEFSVQLEAEVRARACRAPPSVLAVSSRLEEAGLVIYTEEVLEEIGPGEGSWGSQGPVAGQLYREDGGRWVEATPGPREGRWPEAAPATPGSKECRLMEETPVTSREGRWVEATPGSREGRWPEAAPATPGSKECRLTEETPVTSREGRWVEASPVAPDNKEGRWVETSLGPAQAHTLVGGREEAGGLRLLYDFPR